MLVSMILSQSRTMASFASHFLRRALEKTCQFSAVLSTVFVRSLDSTHSVTEATSSRNSDQPRQSARYLSVYATNQRAFHVYKKCDFKEAGRLTKGIKFPDGTYTDEILMKLLLN